MTEEVKKETTKRVAKAPVKKVVAKKTVTTTKKKVTNNGSVSQVDAKKGVADTPKTETAKTSQVDSKKTEVVEKPLKEYLPRENYYPRFSKNGMIGTGGCVIIPNRILRFIEENPSNWYMIMEQLPFYTEIDFLYTLLYYIIEDGYVNIHEVGSKSYFKLTIGEDGGDKEETERYNKHSLKI